MMIIYTQSLDQRNQGTVGLKLKSVSEPTSLEMRARFDSPPNQTLLLSLATENIFLWSLYLIGSVEQQDKTEKLYCKLVSTFIKHRFLWYLVHLLFLSDSENKLQGTSFSTDLNE